MSGHSKWATIHRKKEKTDAQRGKIFTKIGRELAIAVREGGADPDANSKLRDAIAKAKAANMPNDNIARSIKRAAGDGGATQYEEIIYEGYGPGGVAVIVEAVTDNRNRTTGEVRHIFDKYGGALGATGCVGWMFDRKGKLIISRENAPAEDDMMMIALEAGADDFAVEEEYYEITTQPTDFSAVREALEAQNLTFLSAELERIPQNTVAVTQPDMIKVIQIIMEKFDDQDDVQNYYHNAELPEEDEDA